MALVTFIFCRSSGLCSFWCGIRYKSAPTWIWCRLAKGNCEKSINIHRQLLAWLSSHRFFQSVYPQKFVTRGIVLLDGNLPKRRSGKIAGELEYCMRIYEHVCVSEWGAIAWVSSYCMSEWVCYKLLGKIVCVFHVRWVSIGAHKHCKW